MYKSNNARFAIGHLTTAPTEHASYQIDRKESSFPCEHSIVSWRVKSYLDHC